jgi:ABC-type Mn2+/Zn2+ transport system permease subunit
MITGFLQSWELFHNAYLAGWLMGILLSMLGVIVVARDQIFLGAAVSQASMGGIALGMAAGYWTGASETAFIRSDAFLAGVAAVFAVGAALLTARGGRPGRETHEALTGWVFLLGGAGSVLLLVHSPHGLEEIHRLAASSIIGADGADVAAFAALAVLSGAALVWLRRSILVMTIDPAMGPAVGVRTGLWSFAWAAWLGLAVSMSIRSAGMLYAFGSLVLPAMLSKRLCREVWTMFWAAPLLHIAAALPGFVLANHYDLPPAQVVVVLLCAVLLPTLRR